MTSGKKNGRHIAGNVFFRLRLAPGRRQRFAMPSGRAEPFCFRFKSGGEVLPDAVVVFEPLVPESGRPVNSRFINKESDNA
jgi:hypothetical protein